MDHGRQPSYPRRVADIAKWLLKGEADAKNPAVLYKKRRLRQRTILKA